MLKTQKPEPRKARAPSSTSSLPDDAALLGLLQPFESTLQRFDAALVTHAKIESACFEHLRNDLEADRKTSGQPMGLSGARSALDEAHEAHTVVVDAAAAIAARSLAGLKFKARIALETEADSLPPLIQSILSDILTMKEAQQ